MFESFDWTSDTATSSASNTTHKAMICHCNEECDANDMTLVAFQQPNLHEYYCSPLRT